MATQEENDNVCVGSKLPTNLMTWRDMSEYWDACVWGWTINSCDDVSLLEFNICCFLCLQNNCHICPLMDAVPNTARFPCASQSRTNNYSVESATVGPELDGDICASWFSRDHIFNSFGSPWNHLPKHPPNYPPTHALFHFVEISKGLETWNFRCIRLNAMRSAHGFASFAFFRPSSEQPGWMFTCSWYVSKGYAVKKGDLLGNILYKYT